MTMILRHLVTKRAKHALTTVISRNLQEASPSKHYLAALKFNSPLSQSIPAIWLSKVDILTNRGIGAAKILSPYGNAKQPLIDPLASRNIYEIITPSTAINILKIYDDNPPNITKNISEPLSTNLQYIDPLLPGRPLKKEAVRMIRIRRRKMRKHKLKKLRKRMKFVFEKIRMRREIRKEQAFRLELLTQIEDVQNFDAKAYVKDIIHTLRYYPKPETYEERKERFRLLKKKNLSNTVFIKPRFDV